MQHERNQQQRIGIFLEKTEPNKIDEEWSVGVIATVKRGPHPIPSVPVQFSLGTEPQDSAILTDGAGMAAKDFVLRKGAYAIFARLPDGTSSRTTIVLKEEHAKKPARLLIHKRSAGGNHQLGFQVLAEDNAPLSGAVIKITDPEKLEWSKECATDGKGGASCDLVSTEKEKLLVVQVLGSDLRRTVRIYNA